MSKRTASKNRIDVAQSCQVVASLRTKEDGRRILTVKGEDGAIVKSANTICPQVADGSELSEAVVISAKREVATLLVPMQSCIVRRAKAYLQASGARRRQTKDGLKEYALQRVPKDMLVPLHCRLVVATIPAPGTGTDQHIRDTRNGHALRRDYSAKKGPKRTFRIDGLPNGEEIDRPIQGNAELTGARNRPEAADCYWR